MLSMMEFKPLPLDEILSGISFDDEEEIKTYVWADAIPDYGPDDGIHLTAGKRYEIFNPSHHNNKDGSYLANIQGDTGLTYYIYIGYPCAYLDDGFWNVETI